MTSQKIIDNAIAVLNEDFYAPLDIIAGQAGVNRRTLHRHFKDRAALIDACWADMMQTWHRAMLAAYHSSTDPVVQLEQMLYAGIDCGVKYAFLNTLQTKYLNEKAGAVENEAYEQAKNNWFSLVPELQRQKLISDSLSVAWIRMLFVNMINTTIQALRSGDVAPNDIKKFAWYSFSRSIGLL
ncbi:TetR/AcrR family transcriptional regulator [Mucilaginibacter sp. SG564]|uniref:TetR/AcrR family transcriptional regulator n=1 Tax=unclassified Mucilaginibacter TaxID=2617802 RepID=UPI001551EBD4|nr:TetR/AcrR family transcriptional regulator [Mucilaginibacter sp. SG564]NOW96604.1 AcrR family transcriptional regulator [Mucilaginibacter sp. SG564]